MTNYELREQLAMILLDFFNENNSSTVWYSESSAKTIDKILNLIGREECPECDGTGIDESRYISPLYMPEHNDYSCPKCDGTGWKDSGGQKVTPEGRAKG